MSAKPISILGGGMVTGIGLTAQASCVAIRCAIDNFQETRFMDSGGEWIIGSEVPLEEPWRGKTKLTKMLARALQECFERHPNVQPEQTPLLLCLAEKDRPGRIIDDDNEFFRDLCTETGFQFHEKSSLISQGRVSVSTALYYARKLIYEARIPCVVIAATDGLLVAPTLASYEARDRLLTSQNSNGFIPGEAAAAILVQPPYASKEPQLLCSGLGFGTEKATADSELPLRADGLVQAIKAALAEASCEMGDLDFRITDISGEQYHFKEASLALSRTLRKRKEEFDIWHPADCIGEVGVVAGLAMLIVAFAACREGYSKGNNILMHLGTDDGKRVALVIRYGQVRTH